ncbi:MAG: hypothetical protein JWL72_1185 [Ilumatobacteraceae bacterium]|nr:hypothetical protein [Ilumatobacteraceae bacterium]
MEDKASERGDVHPLTEGQETYFVIDLGDGPADEEVVASYERFLEGGGEANPRMERLKAAVARQAVVSAASV